MDMLDWLLSLILGDDSCHMDLNMVLYMVLCDYYMGYLDIRQDQTRISLWILNHEK